MWSAPFKGEHRSGRRGQPGRPSAGMSASMRGCVPDTRPAPPSVTPRSQALRESGSDAVSAPNGLHPGCTGLVPVLRLRRPSPLRRQGEVAAPPPAQLLAGFGQADAPDGPDGGPGRPRRVDRGRQRGRRADSGALADPGAPASLQRPSQGRQELPLAGHHPERGVAATRQWCEGANARACATSVPTAMPTPSARPSTS